MRVLLDENTGEELEDLLPMHEVRHMRALGWAGKKNGVLLGLASEAGFEVMITIDKRMRHEQNLKGKPALVVLDIHPISIPNQIACLGKIIDSLEIVRPGEVHVIEGPHAKRAGHRR